MRKLLFLLTLILLVSSAQAGLVKKRYNLSICTIFKDEAPYLKEWIEYHRLIGVDHFYLYDLGSIDAYRKVLSPYIRNQVVTLIPWKSIAEFQTENETLWVMAVQVSAYENAVRWKAVRHTKWLVFLDVDEFLVPCTDKKLSEVLQEYDSYPGVTLPIEYYNASSRSVLPARKLVIESTEITTPPKPTLMKAVDKTIFKPEMCTIITWPPYRYVFQDEKQAVPIEKGVLRINSYENRLKFQKIERMRKKVNVEKGKITDSTKQEILNLGYEIEDPEKPIYRYVPEVYKRMGLSIGQ